MVHVESGATRRYEELGPFFTVALRQLRITAAARGDHGECRRRQDIYGAGEPSNA
jgi:hypothetical protein